MLFNRNQDRSPNLKAMHKIARLFLSLKKLI